MREKRGQITVFIIIGIVLLFSTALIIYIRSQIAAVPAEELVPKVADVPVEVQPIKAYVEQCVDRIAKDGLKIIGEHGGYLDTSQFTANPANPTQGNAVELFPGSKFLVPYWYHLESDNNCRENCQFASEAPPLCKAGRRCLTSGQNSIEEQLQDYVAEHLRECSTFEQFKEQGFEITEIGNITVDASVRERDVVLVARWPIQTKRQESVQKIEEYLSITPSKMKELYEMAYDILNYESTNCFVEKHEINYLSFYQGTSSSDLPPESLTTFGTQSQTIWVQTQVEDRVQRLTQDSLRRMNIFNTSGFAWPTAEQGSYPKTRQAVQDQTVFFPLRRFHDASVNFFYYPWWNPYFEVKPNQGGIITPSNVDLPGAGFIPAIFNPISPRNYEFFYMYSHPLIVEIRSPDERDRTKQELFRFATESNIRSNKCLSANVPFLKQESGESLLCDPEFRTEENYTIVVSDDMDNDVKIGNAAIYFSAGDGCILGYTNSNGTLVTTMPQAFGGFLNIKKEGYLSRAIHQDDFEIDLDTTLKPLIDKDISAKAIDPSLVESIKASSSSTAARQLLSQVTNLTREETMILSIKRLPDDYQDEEQDQVVMFDKGSWSQETIQLTPGTYDVTIQLFLNRNITLPEEHDRICTPGATAPDLLGKTVQEILEAGAPGCVKTPVDASCKPRGDSPQDYQSGDCYKQGYTCESINNALKKNSGAVSEYQKIACINGYFGLGNTDLTKLSGYLIPSVPCEQKVCASDIAIDLPSQTLTVVPNGGALLTEETSRWIIDDYGEMDGSTASFYLFRQDAPKRMWDMQDSLEYQELSRNFRYVVEPEVR